MTEMQHKTEDELQEIIRRAENTNISGSQFQLAKIELELRDRTKNSFQNPKWWEKTWVQLIVIIGAMAGIIGLYYSIKK
jgi:hypothetical protein